MSTDALDLGCDCPSWRCAHAICRACERECPDCVREADEGATETDAVVEQHRRDVA